MKSVGSRKSLRRAIPLVAFTGLMVASSSSQETPPHGTALLLKDYGLPGIDLGLRDQETPVDPARRGAHEVVRHEGGSAGSYLRGSIIVKFRAGTDVNAVAAAMSDVGGSTIDRPSHADFEIVQIPVDADPEGVSAELRARTDVEYAQPRYLNHAMARPNDPLYNMQWSLPLLDMERVWDIQPAAADQIIVAVLDTGVAFRTATMRYNAPFAYRYPPPGGALYPALGVVDVPFAVAPELGDAKFVTPRDFIWNNSLPFDLDGHGTHVSGTIGQLTNNGVGVAGMAYNVRIMPVKVIDAEFWDDYFNAPFAGTDDVVARGVRYAADNGAKVINMSIGRAQGGPSSVVDDAIRYAISRGTFVAVAAGNSADEGNAPSRTAESAPNIAGMVAVGSVGRNLERAFYSTTNSYVELAAPGGDQRRDGLTGGVLQQTLSAADVETWFPDPSRFGPPIADRFAYRYFQGTSMATPHVAAFAALLMQQGITNPAAVEAAMKQFALDLGTPGVDTSYGHGLIQPRATLRGLGLAR